MTTLAQWRKGNTPHPTALRRIAGTLVEIGIDYFATARGLIDQALGEKEAVLRADHLYRTALTIRALANWRIGDAKAARTTAAGVVMLGPNAQTRV